MKPAREFTQADDLLAIVDGLAAQVTLLRSEIVRRDEARLRDQAGLIDAARQIARADYMTNAEVAGFLGVSLSSVQQGVAGTNCLYRARVTNGRKVTHERRRVELHKQNVADRGHCDDCDQAGFQPLRIIKPKGG